MEKKEITIDNPVAVGELTLIPVVQVSSSYWWAGGGASLFGIKQPVAVVMISMSAKRAFRITGEEVSLDQLIQEFSGIKEMLEGV